MSFFQKFDIMRDNTDVVSTSFLQRHRMEEQSLSLQGFGLMVMMSALPWMLKSSGEV